MVKVQYPLVTAGNPAVRTEPGIGGQGLHDRDDLPGCGRTRVQSVRRLGLRSERERYSANAGPAMPGAPAVRVISMSIIRNHPAPCHPHQVPPSRHTR